MKKKELKSAVKQLLHQVSELNVRVTKLEYPPKEEIELLVEGKKVNDTLSKYNSPFDPKLIKDILPKKEEKKDLEVGKWYKYPQHKKWMICITKVYPEDVVAYGIDNGGNWMKKGGWSFVHDHLHLLIEATPEEIQKYLTKEAIKRGHTYDIYSWNHEQNTLYGHRGNDVGHDILFENGVWSDVKYQDKPKVGDMVIVYNQENKFSCIRPFHEIDEFHIEHTSFYYYELATKERVEDLLFNK